MKKSFFLLTVVGMLLACSTGVLAVNLTSRLWAFQINGAPNVNLQQNAAHAHGYGWVTFKTDIKGEWDISVKLFSGAPNYTYIVRSNGIEYGKFKTDRKGTGGLTFHDADASVMPPNLDASDSVNIWAKFTPLPSGGGVDMTYLLWCANFPLK